MDTTASNRRLRVLLTAIGNGNLVPQPDFQRRLVWINKDKIEFIRTVLEGYPFPEIYIAAGRLHQNRGRSRSLGYGSTAYYNSLSVLQGLAQYLRLAGLIPTYDQLGEEGQVAFLEYKVVVRDLGNMPIDQIKAGFPKN